MILLINICNDKLHYYEFVKPIEDILNRKKIEYIKRHYKEIKDGEFGNVDKIIICGTSLRNDDFVSDINDFSWLKNIDKSVLGICGGMHIIGLVSYLDRQVDKFEIKNNFSNILKNGMEIGFFKERFDEDFLGIKEGEEVEVYHLHNNYVDFGLLGDFDVVSKGNLGISQAIKHKKKNIYGVLFHPEVRNKEIILEFVENG